MRLINILSLPAIAGCTMGNPVVQRAVSVQIQNFHADLYSNNSLGTLQFAVQSPGNNIDDSCYIYWNPSGAIQPGMDPNKCAQDHFEFGFRYGLQIENFSMYLNQVGGTTQAVYQVLNSEAKDSKWVCTKDPNEGIKESCEYNGVLSINF
ncbi:hypothetical protein N7478_004841 [Penicillium angulare]|uniref:uncharacterized protein n=1 Tax=Penicillium angulare TaxID=116970 RepID=UPI0025418221|nr:uncharacterized protein N7478_004841 [Penicillium angulare]KAJ5279469.1 hypothetical protein N7478_004841 [Penicillium angulare]